MSDLRDQIRRSSCLEEVLAHLRQVEFSTLSSTDVAAVHRALKKFPSSPDARIAFVGNQTIEPLPDYIDVAAACRGVVAHAHVGAYNQYFQDILDPKSELRAFEPQIIFLFLSMRELAPAIHDSFTTLSREDIDEQLQRIVRHIGEWIEQAKATTTASLVVANFASPLIPQFGIADYSTDMGEIEFYAKLNLALLALLRNDTRAHFFDLDRVTGNFGKQRAFDYRMYFIAHRDWSEALLPAIATEALRYLEPMFSRTRKCLVVDLDNTLWGGIIGEDGVDGIKVGTGSPVEEAYLAFQHVVRSLKDRGIILAISSKNNESDVREVFERRVEMPLSLDDFSAWQINWDSKHEQLIRIAATLNIGVDSLVFCDDNPVECALIREMLPDVRVIELCGDPAEFAGRLKHIVDFERLTLTAEDRVKTRQYTDDRKRVELQSSAGDLNTYFASLETHVSIRPARERDIARVHQLFNKTNQFNVTTKRYAMSDVERFLREDEFDMRVIDVKDRFGDLGTVGIVLIDRRSDAAEIDSFIMSCRAMGRQVETAVMNVVKADYLQNGRYRAVLSKYIPTKKNKPVELLFEDQGFTAVEKNNIGEKTYRLDAADAALIDCSHIRVSTEVQ